LTHIASTLAAIFWLIYIASPPRSQGLRGSSFSIFLLKVSSDMGGDQELCAKLQCSTADRADGSAEVASEIVKHLKKLAQHVRDLESTISATDVQPSSTHADGSTVRNRIENSSGSRLGCRKADRHITPESDQVYYTLPQDLLLGLPNNHPMFPTCTIDNGQWITWKWRWAASSTRWWLFLIYSELQVL
jgi:hypothetical protein